MQTDTLSLDFTEEKTELNSLSNEDMLNGVPAYYYKLETGSGVVHVNIVHVDGEIKRIFINTTPIGTEPSGMASLIGIFISRLLERGEDISYILKQLNSIKSDKPYGFGKNRVESVPHAVGKAIEKFRVSQAVTL